MLISGFAYLKWQYAWLPQSIVCYALPSSSHVRVYVHIDVHLSTPYRLHVKPVQIRSKYTRTSGRKRVTLVYFMKVWIYIISYYISHLLPSFAPTYPCPHPCPCIALFLHDASLLTDTDKEWTNLLRILQPLGSQINYDLLLVTGTSSYVDEPSICNILQSITGYIHTSYMCGVVILRLRLSGLTLFVPGHVLICFFARKDYFRQKKSHITLGTVQLNNIYDLFLFLSFCNFYFAFLPIKKVLFVLETRTPGAPMWVGTIRMRKRQPEVEEKEIRHRNVKREIHKAKQSQL